MARQYDVEDLLNSDATDPDGEPTPIATNDDVRDGKIIVETADGTGKIGDVSQIVADYLKKSAGFFTEIRPYYIVRPATSQPWTGTWELFLHGIDDGGLSDAVNITIGINGVVVHTQAWTVSTGARDIEFSISTAESTALIASPPTGSYARCYVAFHDGDGNEIVIRHFSLKLVDTVPKIPEAEIPDSIARDDEVTAAIAAALAAHPGAFSANLALGNYENANGGAIAGHYVRNSATRVDISYHNIANENKETEIRAIQLGYGLKFGDKIFVIEWTNENASYRSFNGFWAAGEVDATAESSTVAISVIQHELRMIRFMTASQLKGLLPELQTAVDKTVDIHLQETPGVFANMNDATIAGLSLIQKTTEADRALAAGTYNFGALTWQPTSVDIPNDSNEYYVVARIAKSQGRIETQFRVTNNSDREPTEYLRGEIQDDANWRYYRVVGDYDNIWTLQRRPATTHTRWDAPLGDPAIRQVQALIPPIPQNEGLTPQQKAQFESLVAKTADLLIETRETWVAATDASFLALPADNAQLARVRAGNVPIGLTGWTTDVTTTDARVILIRVPATAQLADYRILIGDDNAVRLDSYGVDATGTQYAYMTSTSLSLQEAARIRLQHHGTATHTRFIGMLADAIMARLLPDPSGSTAGFVAKVNAALNGFVLAAETGGGLTMQQLTDALANYVTETEFANRHNHTPNRLSHLPARLLNKELLVLESTTHWSDKFYRVMPTTQNATAGGTTWTYRGNNLFAFSTELPAFGNTGLPSIFRADRIAAVYTRQHIVDGISNIPINIKIILDKALIPTIPDSQNPAARNAYYAGLRLNFRGALSVSLPLTQSAFFADEPGTQLSDNEMTFGGKTYVAVTPVLDGASETETHVPNLGITLRDIAANGGFYDFHISYTDPDTDAVTFLSDDTATAWVAGNEYPAGLYEGDGNGHPIEVIAPVASVWEEVLAKSDTYIRASAPNNRFGVDGNKWFNLANGKGYIKQSGSWVEVTDFVIQSELNAAIAGITGGNVEDWSDIPLNTSIAVGRLVEYENGFYACWTAHTKTATTPPNAEHQWRFLSNYIGGWRSGNYQAGTLTWRSGNLYVSNAAVVRNDPSPTGSTNTKWVQLTNVDPPVRYAELTINASIALSQTYASLTFATALAKSQNATGVIARASSGSAISIAAGSYVVDTHIVFTDVDNDRRSNYDVQLYDGTNVIDEKTHLGYLRASSDLGDESISSHHIFTVTQATTLQVRCKISNTRITSATTGAGGTVIIRKI